MNGVDRREPRLGFSQDPSSCMFLQSPEQALQPLHYVVMWVGWFGLFPTRCASFLEDCALADSVWSMCKRGSCHTIELISATCFTQGSAGTRDPSCRGAGQPHGWVRRRHGMALDVFLDSCLTHCRLSCAVKCGVWHTHTHAVS